MHRFLHCIKNSFAFQFTSKLGILGFEMTKYLLGKIYLAFLFYGTQYFWKIFVGGGVWESITSGIGNGWSGIRGHWVTLLVV